MCDVTRSTFETFYPVIAKAVKAADFVAVDSEFTGLRINERSRPSLFDTSDIRYEKLRESVQHFTLPQIGLSAFINDLNQNRYEVHSFNFYLRPCAYGPVDATFTCQASCLTFLSKYKFDFNKFVYEGISYLNNPQEDELRRCFENKMFFKGLDRDIDERELCAICSMVAEWFVTSKEGDIYTIKKEDVRWWDEYLLHTEIRNRFPLVWTITDPFGNIAVECVSAEKRKARERENYQSEEQKSQELLNSMLGFTRVFRLLVDAKKPIVGHNCLMDLLFMYDKFYEPLPAKWNDFKRKLHYLFPKVYDTKHMALYLVRAKMCPTLLVSTDLHSLFLALTSENGIRMVLHPPIIEFAPGNVKYMENIHLHEAGSDSYECGCVFLRMIHLYMQREKKVGLGGPVKFLHFTPLLKEFLNRVNVIRAAANHYRLDGRDPPSERPQLLVASMRRHKSRLNIDQLAVWLSSYGVVDVQQLDSSQALVACGNFGCARDIMTSFLRHPHMKICKYSSTRHSPTVRKLLWLSTLVTGGLCVCLLVIGLRKQ